VSRYFDKLQKELGLKHTGSQKSSKTNPILISLAETIGSTLGSIAAKADAAQKAATKALKKTNKVAAKRPNRGRKKLARQSKRVASSARAGIRGAAVKRRPRRSARASK
jgi:hypothetical protein